MDPATGNFGAIIVVSFEVISAELDELFGLPILVGLVGVGVLVIVGLIVFVGVGALVGVVFLEGEGISVLVRKGLITGTVGVIETLVGS